MAEKPGVMIYFDLIPVIDSLSDHDCGILFRAIMRYARFPCRMELNKRLEPIWSLIQQRIDSDSTRYFETVRKREYSAYVRWAKRNDQAVMPYATWAESRGEYLESVTYYPNKVDEIRAKFPGQAPDAP